MARSLPPLPELAAQAADALGGTWQLVPGDEPVAAIALGGSSVLLVRDHGWTVTLSLPHEGSWQVSTPEAWRDALAAIRAAPVASAGVSLADAVIALAPTLERVTGVPWTASFPGTPVPREAWLRCGERNVGLFQEPAGVRVVVWVALEHAARAASTREQLAELAPWLEQTLARQATAIAAAAAAAAREAALPVPSIAEVLAALRDGARIQTTGGRYSVTFFWDGRLRCDVFDEGDRYVRDASKGELEQHLELYASAFRAALGKPR